MFLAGLVDAASDRGQLLRSRTCSNRTSASPRFDECAQSLTFALISGVNVIVQCSVRYFTQASTTESNRNASDKRKSNMMTLAFLCGSPRLPSNEQSSASSFIGAILWLLR